AHVPKPEPLGAPQAKRARGRVAPVEASDDRELVRRAPREGKEAFEELVRREQHRVFAVAGGVVRRGEDGGGVAQEVVVKAGFSVEEIADVLKLNANTVKVRLFRARRRVVGQARAQGN